MTLDASQQRLMLQRIAVWRGDPKVPVACPTCARDGLVIVDASARPYAEWCIPRCAACKLDDTPQMALGPSVPSLD